MALKYAKGFYLYSIRADSHLRPCILSSIIGPGWPAHIFRMAISKQFQEWTSSCFLKIFLGWCNLCDCSKQQAAHGGKWRCTPSATGTSNTWRKQRAQLKHSCTPTNSRHQTESASSSHDIWLCPEVGQHTPQTCYLRLKLLETWWATRLPVDGFSQPFIPIYSETGEHYDWLISSIGFWWIWAGFFRNQCLPWGVGWDVPAASAWGLAEVRCIGILAMWWIYVYIYIWWFPKSWGYPKSSKSWPWLSILNILKPWWLGDTHSRKAHIISIDMQQLE